MADNIKLNRILPSLSPTRRVKGTDPRGRNNQQAPFKASLERKQKKREKDDPGHTRDAGNVVSLKAEPRDRRTERQAAVKRSQANQSSHSKIIDIRV
jgi:hypothetical protein